MLAWAAFAAAVLAASFFALAELALLSTSRLRLRQWVRRTIEGETWVRAADVVERPYRLLSPILVGRALAVTAAGLVAAWLVARRYDSAAAIAGAASLLVAAPLFVLDTLAGALARARGPQLLPGVSLVLRLSSWIFRPLVRAADGLAAIVLRAVGSAESRAVSGRRILDTLLDESERAGVVEPAEREIIAGVFAFGRTPVEAVMTPFEAMVAAPAGARACEITALMRRTGYSRIPLHGRRDPRRIVGMVHVFDLFKLDPDERPHPRRVVMTPPERPCDELLVEMKRRRVHMGIVTEGKRAMGMVTMEDLVEELVGEIRDEHEARTEGRGARARR